MPVYNASAFLDKCLTAIYKSTYKDFEIIVVDDCSKDESLAIAQRFPVRTVTMQKNCGAAKVRNLGARLAQGKILLFVDADIIIHNDTFERIMHILQSEPKVKVLGVALAKESGNSGFGPSFVALFDYFYLQLWDKEEVRRPTSCFFSQCGAIYKDVFNEIGGFDESYKGAGIEEYEFGRRLSLKYTIWLYRNIEVIHCTQGIVSRSKKLFKRCFPYVPYFLKVKSMEVNDPIINDKEILSTICILLLTATLIFSFTFPLLRYSTLIFLILFLYFNYHFLCFLAKEKGFLFMINGFAAAVLIYLSLSLGIVFALFVFIFKSVYFNSYKFLGNIFTKGDESLFKEKNV